MSKSFAGRTTRWVWNGNVPVHEWRETEPDASLQEPPPAYATNAQLDGVLQQLRDLSTAPVAPQAPPPREQCMRPFGQGPWGADGTQTWSMDLDIYGWPVMSKGTARPAPSAFGATTAEADGYIRQDPIGLAGGNPTLYGDVRDPLVWTDEYGLASRADKYRKRSVEGVKKMRSDFDKKRWCA